MTSVLEATLWMGAILPPFVAAFVLSFGAWFRLRYPETFTHRLSTGAFALTFLATTVLGVGMLASGTPAVTVASDRWFAVAGYHFPVTLVADHLSVPFAIFSSGLVTLVAVFSGGYLHRERGFRRYYVLLCLFGAAMNLTVLAGSVDFLLFGWEIVGLTSVFLIAFFYERPAPVKNGFRAFVIYRFCDIGLLGAAVWLHHSLHGQTVSHATLGGQGTEAWWGVPVPRGAGDALIVGALLVWASLGKGAQVPFGSWLPRAMEGPTPSSAIFYGALSVHLGPYLLLRAAPLLDRHPVLGFGVVLIGLGTAIHGTLVGRVQSDIKCALAYASMTQVGLIFVEIGLGLRYLALLHIVGHAALRCLQLLRSPSILQDRSDEERYAGAPLERLGGHFERSLPREARLWLYRGSLERGFLDSLFRDYVAKPVVHLARRLDRGQEWLNDILLGRRSPRARPLASTKPRDPEHGPGIAR